MTSPAAQAIGQTYGRLTPTKWIGSGRMLCTCTCGRERIALLSELKSGRLKTCGKCVTVSQRGYYDLGPAFTAALVVTAVLSIVAWHAIGWVWSHAAKPALQWAICEPQQPSTTEIHQ